MIKDSENESLPLIFRMLDEKIKQWEMMEAEYHQIINSKLDEYIKNSQTYLRKKIVSSQIIACTDGLFIEREANKHNSGSILVTLFPGDMQKARQGFKFKKMQHLHISNKVQFHSFDVFNYNQTDSYDVNSKAINDFQDLISNDNLTDEGFIRTISDVIELGIMQDFERGQLIFRGQINDEWELIPKLLRDYQEDAELMEMALCANLLSGIKSPYLHTYDPIDHLMNLQHFGIPTRLLDWTSDLLIALFFACYDKKEEYNQKNGNLYAIERYHFTPFKVNSSENNSLKQPINKDDFLADFKKRLDTNDIHVFEPVIKNPRLRIQDGCFMFFPFLPLNADEKKFVTLHDYMGAKNKVIDQENENRESPVPKISIRNKKVDKNFKKSILKELNEEHDISERTLFAEIKHIETVSKYYLDLYEKAKGKVIFIKSQKKK